MRLTSLPHELDYFLDDATEAGEITTATSMVLRLYGDHAVMTPVLSYKSDGFSLTRRRQACRELSVYAEEVMTSLPARRRAALLAIAYPHLIRNITSLAEVCASWAFEDGRKGGALLPFRDRLRAERDGQPTPRLKRQLYAPSFIRRYVRENESVSNLRLTAVHFFGLCDRWRHEIDEADMMEVTDDLDRQMRLIRASERARLMPAKNASPPWRVKIEQRKARRIARRAAMAAAALLGASTVGAFARGEPVMIPGRELALRVTKTGSLHAAGHGQLAVALLDKAGTHLADLCVYVDKTPALDQLTAFALHMDAGLEQEILATANVIRTTEAGAQHPALAERVSKRIDAARELVTHANLLRSDWERERFLQNEYYAATGHLWREAVGIRVAGRRWAKIAPVFG